MVASRGRNRNGNPNPNPNQNQFQLQMSRQVHLPKVCMQLRVGECKVRPANSLNSSACLSRSLALSLSLYSLVQFHALCTANDLMSSPASPTSSYLSFTSNLTSSLQLYVFLFYEEAQNERERERVSERNKDSEFYATFLKCIKLKRFTVCSLKVATSTCKCAIKYYVMLLNTSEQ